MEISKDLKLLAEEFKKSGFDLYITGGYVRDSLLGISSSDIDISSNAPYNTVLDICKKIKFRAIPINKHLGTLKIISSLEEYEYTQFRSESYSDGKHSPDSVIFVDDIETDAKRRDLSINALYYHILNSRIVDNVHGQKDLENRIIRTCNHPSITLQDDGLRILRTIRFASLLDFKISKQTYKYLKLYKHKLKDISKERILKELSSIVIADLIHHRPNHTAIKIFNKLKLYKYIFNSSFENIKLNAKEQEQFYSLDHLSRLMGLYMIILKKYNTHYTQTPQLKFSCNLLLGKDGIKDSSDHIVTLEKLYLIYQNLEYQVDIVNATINYLTLSNAERSIIDTMLSKKSKDILSDNISIIKSNNLPLGVHDLDISAQELIDAGIERMYISKITSTLFNQVIEMKVANQKDDLITLAKSINETFINIAKQMEGEKNENNLLSSRRKSSESKKTKKSR